MGKKKIASIIGLIVIGAGATAFITFNLMRPEQVSSPIVSFQLTPTPVEEELVLWKDQAEFSFQYPKSLALDPHDEDNENYAHVELKSATHEGNLIVWVKDTQATSLADWEKKEKIQNAIDSKLDGEPAKKVLLSGEIGRIVTSTLFSGYLYQVEVNSMDFEYWNRVYNQVLSSFKFIPSETVGSKTPVTSYGEEEANDIPAGESYEEEIIE